MRKKIEAILICLLLVLALVPAAGLHELAFAAATSENPADDILVLYELDSDQTLKTAEIFSENAALKVSGDVKPVIIDSDDGTVSLQLNNRVNNYDGVDILRDILKINDVFMSGTYTITVNCHVDDAENTSAAQFVLGMTESPWGELSSRVTPDSDGNFELTITKEYSASDLTTLGYNYRIQTPPAVLTSFYIDNIIVTVQGAVEEEVVEIVNPEWDFTLDSIKDTYSDYFMIGNIMEPHQVSDADITTMFKQQYGVVTSENTMKPVNMTSAKGIYNFTNADMLINWAEDNGLLVHGHTLVWHSQSAAWLTTNSDGTPLTRAEAKANLEEYINTVAQRYSGRLISWDVVNEAFRSGVSDIPEDWRDALRKDESLPEGSPWYTAYANGADLENGEDGSDYIYDAFVLARLADPDATLYYNDFNETEPGKREAIAMMVEELNAKWKADERDTDPGRLLIEGIGMQAHYWTGDLKAENVEASIKRFIETGAEISVSELDIPLGDYQTYKQRTTAPSEEEITLQADLYRQVFEVYKRYSDDIVRVTFWGKADPQSWRFEGYPLLFDKAYAPKEAYWSVMSVAASDEEIIADEPETPSNEDDAPVQSSTPESTTVTTSNTTSSNPESTNSPIIWIVVSAVIIIALIAFIIKRRGSK